MATGKSQSHGQGRVWISALTEL